MALAQTFVSATDENVCGPVGLVGSTVRWRLFFVGSTVRWRSRPREVLGTQKQHALGGKEAAERGVSREQIAKTMFKI